MIERFSYSSLESYKKCPTQFKLRYLDKIRKKDAGIEAFVGNRVHETLEFLYNEKLSGRIPFYDGLIENFHENWKRNWHERIVIVRKELGYGKANWIRSLAGPWEVAREKKTVKEFFRLGERCIAGFYRKFDPFDQPVIGTEVEFIFSIDENNEYQMKGIADRIDHDGNGNYIIHDYKTGKRLLSQSDADKDGQLATYQIALSQKYNNIESVELKWHYLQHNKIVSSIRSDSEINQLKKSIKLKIDIIRDHINKDVEFGPKESILCNWCYYWKECPAKSTNNDIL